MDVLTFKVTKSLTDLSTLDDIKLVKQGSIVPVADASEALARLNGDNAKLTAILNAGLVELAKSEMRANGENWHTFKLDADGDPTDEINGPFEGQVGDSKKISALVTQLAKSVFGLEKGMKGEARATAKTAAMDMIKNTPAIKDGLAKTAALTDEE